nr:uncharacterized protein LOC117688933 isoform X1 [Crassostrea gigas]
MSDIVDFLTNPQKFPTTNWREKTKEKRKTLLSKLFDFGEDFKISDLENGKSPKLHNVNKSSNTKSVQSNEEHQFHHPATRRFQTTGGKQELSPCVYRGSHKATNN